MDLVIGDARVHSISSMWIVNRSDTVNGTSIQIA